MMSLDFLGQVVAWAARAEDRPKSVAVSGGEPALHPGLTQIIQLVTRKLTPEVSLVTNGLLLDAALLARLSDSGLRTLRLGIDSLDPGKSRPSPGLNPGVLLAPDLIKRAEDIGLKLEINTVLTKFNRRRFMEVLELAIHHRISIKFFEMVSVHKFGEDGSQGIMSTRAQVPLEEFTESLTARYPEAALTLDSTYRDANLVFTVEGTEVRFCRYLCDYGLCWTTGTRIDPGRNAYTCMSLRGTKRIEADIGQSLRSLSHGCVPSR
jgi:GTP 3',8-cyclase